MKLSRLAVLLVAAGGCAHDAGRLDGAGTGSAAAGQPGSGTQTTAAARPEAAGHGGASVGKPGSPVDLRWELAGAPAVGSPLVIRCWLAAGADLAALDVATNVTEGLDLVAAAALPATARKAGDRIPFEITVTPRVDGHHLVSLAVATVTAASGREARAFAIPVVVGDPSQAPLKGEGVPGTDANGRPIRSLPLEEMKGK